MSRQEQLVQQQIIEFVRLERTGGNQLRVSWHPPVAVAKVSIFHQSVPEFDESKAHLVAVVTQAKEWVFQDPQPETRGYYFIRFGHEEEPVAVAERVVPLQGAVNFRDMGGYAAAEGKRVKWGKLYRSADLAGLTEADLAYLQSLELAWICDLRSDAELEHRPSPPIGSAVNEQLSFMASANPQELMGAREITVDMLALMNRGMVRNTALTADYFRRLLKHEGAPTLFHCAAGKDRTGFVASMLLQALGVERETILEDYALTNAFAERFKAQMSGQADAFAAYMSKLTPEVIAALMEARPAYLAAAFEEIDAQYGGFENYWMKGLGLETTDLERLRVLYLD